MITKSAGKRLFVAVLAIAIALGAPAAQAGHDDGPGNVSPAEDNPEGCTTATAEDQEQCGAQGRSHTDGGTHRPPIEVCAERSTEAGGTVTRILPDGPRHDDGSLAFVPGACVYLPPGYATSGLRYPVVYVLHGGGGDQGNWINNGGLDAMMDGFVTAEPADAAIIVMPDGRSGQWYDYEDGSFLIATYVFDHLVPWVDHHFRTIADRQGRAVVGLSNGGYGAMHFAAKRPDLFSVAGGMSSNVGARTLTGLGGSGFCEAVYCRGSLPLELASNMDGVDVILDISTQCGAEAPPEACPTIAVDVAFLIDNREFSAKLPAVGHVGDLDYRETDGAHAWYWWSRWYEERDYPFVTERLLDPMPVSADPVVSPVPESFRYRSIAHDFVVWDHRVVVERDNREFLDLIDVSVGGFEITGSGSATVITAPRYRPGVVHEIVGATDEAQSLPADVDGRLAIDVDLGPSHTADQFTDDANNAESEAGEDYWVTRTVTIDETSEAAAPPPPVTAPTPKPTATSPRAPAPTPAGPGRTTTTTTTLSTTTTSTSTTAPSDAALNPATAPIAAAAVADDDEPGPQLLPTVLFLAALAGGGAYWWRRRTKETA